MKNEIIILTYGTYDLFHKGHENLLKKAKSLGGKIFVGISTDEFNQKKGKKSLQTYSERYRKISSLSYVDFVFPENSWNQKEVDIKKYNANIIVMGDDWKGKFDYLSNHCKVVYFERTKGVSSTQLRKKISKK